MKLVHHSHGYQLWLSQRETENWASSPFSSWPCSELCGRSLYVEIDRNGLCAISVNGSSSLVENLSNDELSACVSDHIAGTPAEQFWPVWK